MDESTWMEMSAQNSTRQSWSQLTYFISVFALTATIVFDGTGDYALPSNSRSSRCWPVWNLVFRCRSTGVDANGRVNARQHCFDCSRQSSESDRSIQLLPGN